MSVNVSSEVLSWLLEPDDPGPRYLALRDLLARPSDDLELLAARAAAHAAPPIATIVDAMEPEGYWGKPGAGYGPKYSSTVWALIMLAQTGATAAADERIARGATYLLDHSLGPHGQLTTNSKGAPSGTVDCLQGNLLMSLIDLEIDDPRLDLAFEWMARTVTGKGMASKEEKSAVRRYYAYKSGPLFRCGVNGDQPCGWGAAKVMLAFGKLPAARRTPMIDEAIRQGVEYLLSIDPATAAYPSFFGHGPSRNWWKFGFPVFYITDILQVIEALVALGYDDDPRLANAFALVRSKSDSQGRWPLEYGYTGKMGEGVEFGRKGRPSKWVTIRALRVLGQVEDIAVSTRHLVANQLVL
ncbi:MAG: nitrogen fixation protein NifH [Chloroflexota bacterium]|jgi:hypothetical protein